MIANAIENCRMNRSKGKSDDFWWDDFLLLLEEELLPGCCSLSLESNPTCRRLMLGGGRDKKVCCL